MADSELAIADAALDAYLAQAALAPTALGRLLRERSPQRGTIHTPAEVAQHPYLWRHTAALMREHAAGLRRFLEQAGVYGPHPPSVALCGAGTSDFVGISVADLLRERLGAPCCNWPTTRITATPWAFLRPGQDLLMVHFARSGNSPESRAVLELGLRHSTSRVRHVVITCNAEGVLAQLARQHPDRVYLVVLHEASNDQALAMTSSFSSMVVAAQALAYLDDLDAFEAIIERVAAAGEHVLAAHADTIYDLAAPRFHRVFFLGNVDLYGAAVESALKVQELTAGHIIARGEDTMAFRHGPISAVDGESLICFFLSAAAYARRYELDVVRQYHDVFRTFGARLVLMGAGAPEVDAAPDDTWVLYDPDGRFDVPPLFQVNVGVLFGQLYGMFLAYRTGINVDQPSVEKMLYSRTVQGVRIYVAPDEATDGISFTT